jgi:hypothetical protein
VVSLARRLNRADTIVQQDTSEKALKKAVRNYVAPPSKPPRD